MNRVMKALCRAAEVADREPIAGILFTVAVMAIMAILALDYNSVVPAY